MAKRNKDGLPKIKDIEKEAQANVEASKTKPLTEEDIAKIKEPKQRIVKRPPVISEDAHDKDVFNKIEGKTLTEQLTENWRKQKMIRKMNGEPVTNEETQSFYQRRSELEKQIDKESELADQSVYTAKKLKEIIEKGEEGNIQPQLTADDIYNAPENVAKLYQLGVSKEAIDEYMQQVEQGKKNISEPAIERLGLQEYYPTINQPLQVGSYSGKIVGNIPIFSSGGFYMPHSILDARKRALDKAAANRTKYLQKTYDNMFKKGAIQLQPQLNEIQWNYIDKLKNTLKSIGITLDEVMSSNSEARDEILRDIQRINTFNEMTLDIDEKVKKLQENILKEDAYVPQEFKKTVDAWMNGSLNVEEYMNNPEKLSKIYNITRYYANYIGALNKVQLDYDQIILPPDKILQEVDGNPEKEKEYKRLVQTIMYGKDANLVAAAALQFVDQDRIREQAMQTYYSMKGKMYLGDIDKNSEDYKELSKKYSGDRLVDEYMILQGMKTLASKAAQKKSFKTSIFRHDNALYEYRNKRLELDKPKPTFYTDLNNIRKDYGLEDEIRGNITKGTLTKEELQKTGKKYGLTKVDDEFVGYEIGVPSTERKDVKYQSSELEYKIPVVDKKGKKAGYEYMSLKEAKQYINDHYQENIKNPKNDDEVRLEAIAKMDETEALSAFAFNQKLITKVEETDGKIKDVRWGEITEEKPVKMYLDKEYNAQKTITKTLPRTVKELANNKYAQFYRKQNGITDNEALLSYLENTNKSFTVEIKVPLFGARKTFDMDDRTDITILEQQGASLTQATRRIEQAEEGGGNANAYEEKYGFGITIETPNE